MYEQMFVFGRQQGRFNCLDAVTEWIKSLDDTEIIPLKLSKWNNQINCFEPIFTYNELQ